MSLGFLHLRGLPWELPGTGRPRLFENGQPLVVNRESRDLEGDSRRRWDVAGTGFEGPELEGRLVDFREGERPRAFADNAKFL